MSEISHNNIGNLWNKTMSGQSLSIVLWFWDITRYNYPPPPRLGVILSQEVLSVFLTHRNLVPRVWDERPWQQGWQFLSLFLGAVCKNKEDLLQSYLSLFLYEVGSITSCCSGKKHRLASRKGWKSSLYRRICGSTCTGLFLWRSRLNRRVAFTLTCIGLTCCNDADHKGKKTKMDHLPTKQE